MPGPVHGVYQWRYLNNIVVSAGLGFSSAFECRPIVSDLVTFAALRVWAIDALPHIKLVVSQCCLGREDVL